MNHVLLDNVTHKDLRIITEKSEKFGDNIGSTQTFPTEFSYVQNEYPIFFRKDSNTGEFQSVVMFGFEKNENLFLDDNGWHADYIPLSVSRQPFLIGFQNQSENGTQQQTPVIHIDMDSPRISQTSGEAVFLEHGGNTPYLEQVCRMMDALHTGINVEKAMFEAYLELDLIEPFTLDVQLNDSSKHQLLGYYTINQEKLNTLSSENIGKLHSTGLLQPAFMAISSLNKIQGLINRKNHRLSR